MKTIKYILLSLAACVAVTASAIEDTLTFVRTDGSTVAFSTSGLTITYDDFAHAIVTNDETSATIDLANMDYMCFGEVEASLKGDVNNDGLVKVNDVSALINHLLSGGNDDADDVNNDNSDTNLDNKVSITDVAWLIDYLLTGAWPQ